MKFISKGEENGEKWKEKGRNCISVFYQSQDTLQSAASQHDSRPAVGLVRCGHVCKCLVLFRFDWRIVVMIWLRMGTGGGLL